MLCPQHAAACVSLSKSTMSKTRSDGSDPTVLRPVAARSGVSSRSVFPCQPTSFEAFRFLRIPPTRRTGEAGAASLRKPQNQVNQFFLKRTNLLAPALLETFQPSQEAVSLVKHLFQVNQLYLKSKARFLEAPIRRLPGRRGAALLGEAAILRQPLFSAFANSRPRACRRAQTG